MSHQEDGLRPEEFAEAAEAAIQDAIKGEAGQVSSTLAEAGLLGVCTSEKSNGLGLDLRFAIPLAQAAGRLRLRFALAEQILLARCFAGSEIASSLALGLQLATIAWQGSTEDTWIGHARRVQDARWLLVRHQAGAVLLDVLDAPRQSDRNLDPENPQVWLNVTQCPVVSYLDQNTTEALWRDGALLMAATVHGAAEYALNAAVEHTSTRVQFERPLSSKQAIRHWLSRMKLYHEAAGTSIARALNENEWGATRDPFPVLSTNLKYATFIIEKSIQLHGGMGFTWDIPLHHALREVRKIDAAWDGSALTKDIGRRFMESTGSQ
jgi:alkylation response protein AidB-like acyl-CoA dehydrogenase